MAIKRFFTKNVLGVRLVAVTRREIDALARALLLIRRRDPRLFRKFALLAAVLVSPRRGYENAVYMDDDPHTWVCESGTVLESSPAYLAGLLVHEVTHMAQWKRGVRRHGASTEREAYRAQRRFLANIGAAAEMAWLDAQFKSKWWVSPGGRRCMPGSGLARPGMRGTPPSTSPSLSRSPKITSSAITPSGFTNCGWTTR